MVAPQSSSLIGNAAARTTPRLLDNCVLELPSTEPQNSTPHTVRLMGQAILILGDRIVWRGPSQQAAAALQTLQAQGHITTPPEVHDVRGQLVTPGLVDCHTHMVFGGHRADEWERRLAGESYAAIAAAGGGIRATLRATRTLAQQELTEITRSRLRFWLNQGVTTVEIKSGYGLSYDEEIKILRAAKAAAQGYPGTVALTLLAAHAIPPEYDGNRSGYVDMICHDLIPAVARDQLADAVDIFCETIGFSLVETERIIKASQSAGLKVKLHAEQLSASGAARLGAQLGALSCDHLEYLDTEGAAALAASGTVAVLLPGAYYMLRESMRPPVDLLRQHGVPMAVATDFNPGTSPVASLLVAANMSCVLFGLTVAEAYLALTTHAARALGLASQQPYGGLRSGDRADLAIWDASSVAQLFAQIGQTMCTGVYARGQWCPAHSEGQIPL